MVKELGIYFGDNASNTNWDNRVLASKKNNRFKGSGSVSNDQRRLSETSFSLLICFIKYIYF